MLLNNTIKTNERGTTYSSNNTSNKIIVKRGDIFFARLGETEGSEQGGIRPVLIIQNSSGNLHSSTTIIAAITSQINKAKLPVHVAIESNNYNNLEKDSVVLLEQIRTLSKTRFISKIGHLTDKEMEKIDKALLVSVGLLHPSQINNNCEINKKEKKKDEFDISRARYLADQINECQNKITNNTNRTITTKLQQDKMSYIYELKVYCRTFNQDFRFYYNPNTNANVNNERGIEGRRVVNA